MKSMRISKIENGELSFLEGRIWETDKQTTKAFEEQRAYDTGYKEGNICLDLHEKDDLIDTITITQKRFEDLVGS